MKRIKDLVLEAGFDEKSVELNLIPTNYFREIAYNLEHAIHHMAPIKIGIHEVADLVLPAGYGVASLPLNIVSHYHNYSNKLFIPQMGT